MAYSCTPYGESLLQLQAKRVFGRTSTTISARTAGFGFNYGLYWLGKVRVLQLQ